MEVISIAGLPELAWAVSECMLVPALLRLDTPHWCLGVGWVAAAFISMGAQPIVGHLSDRIGRRALAVICVFVSSVSLCTIGLAERYLSNEAAIWTILILFSFADATHDVLYTAPMALRETTDDSTEFTHGRCRYD